MSTICHNRIIDGFRVVLSDGESHHFELSIEDQLNLLEIKSLIENGQKSFIYHETDSLSKEFSLEDMEKIIDSLKGCPQTEIQQAFINLTTRIDSGFIRTFDNKSIIVINKPKISTINEVSSIFSGKIVNVELKNHSQIIHGFLHFSTCNFFLFGVECISTQRKRVLNM